jgi:hypothetical protein
MRVAAMVTAVALIAACARDDRSEAQPPEVPVLLQQAWERTVQEQGAAGAEARFAPVQERNAELRSAIRTRELARVRAAQESLRAEQVRVIASSLGPDGPRQVLDAVADMIAELRDRAEAAAAEGRDVARLRASLLDAGTSHAEAAAALARDEHELALEIALRAVDIVTTARVAARSL